MESDVEQNDTIKFEVELFMGPILSAIGSAITFRFRTRASLEIELLALKHQLKVLRRREKKRPIIKESDRIFWMWLYRIWPNIVQKIVLVRPKTIINWHYLGFRMYWRRKCSRGQPRPWKQLSADKKAMIYRLKKENPLWGVGRISAELAKIGIKVSPSAVHTYLPKSDVPPTPGWFAFIRNHMKGVAAIDFFVVVTLTYRLLYGVVIISHGRRRILHVEVTDHPTQEWATEQIERAFSRYPAPTHLLRDRDRIYGKVFRAKLQALGIKDCVTYPSTPWQNTFAERVIKSIREECLDHVIIFDQRHFKRILSTYVNYYNYSRTHKSLDNDCPVHRPVERPIRGKNIVSIPQVGGLHHRYERRAA